MSGSEAPRRKRFGGFEFLMFFQDENPPHVHIKGADFAAKIRISNGDLLAGDAPNKILKQARRWVEQHRTHTARAAEKAVDCRGRN